MIWLRRILRTLQSQAHQGELDEELQFHLAMREQRNLDEGMGEGEARRNARLRFGNPVVWKERTSEADLMLFLRTYWRSYAMVCASCGAMQASQPSPFLLWLSVLD
jgi:hypothetical protein